MRVLRDLVFFQIAWFSAVVGGAAGLGFLGSCPALALAGYHLVKSRTHTERELILVVAIVGLGLVAESVLIRFGAIRYVGMEPAAVFPPVWIMALWLAFATLPNGALQWLQGRAVLQVLLGGVTAPPSYAGGAALGAATLGADHFYALGLIGAVWAVACPALFAIAARVSPPTDTKSA